MNEEIRLTSGRVIYANHGLVGIAETANGFELGTGYDQQLPWPPQQPWMEPGDALTVAEAKELADLMIDVWIRFKASLKMINNSGA